MIFQLFSKIYDRFIINNQVQSFRLNNLLQKFYFHLIFLYTRVEIQNFFHFVGHRRSLTIKGVDFRDWILSVRSRSISKKYLNFEFEKTAVRRLVEIRIFRKGIIRIFRFICTGGGCTWTQPRPRVEQSKTILGRAKRNNSRGSVRTCPSARLRSVGRRAAFFGWYLVFFFFSSRFIHANGQTLSRLIEKYSRHEMRRIVRDILL